METIIVGDDDIIFRTDVNGEVIGVISVGTAADEYVIYEGTQDVTILLRGGNDMFESTVFSGNVRVYEDLDRPGSIGGNGRIDFKWGDTLVSGKGNDIYRGPHGDAHGRPPAKLWINMEEDELVIPAERVNISGFTLTDVERLGGGMRSAEIETLNLRFITPGSPFANPEVKLFLSDDRNGNEVRPDFVIEYQRGEAREAIRDLLDTWHDGIGHDPLVF